MAETPTGKGRRGLEFWTPIDRDFNWRVQQLEAVKLAEETVIAAAGLDAAEPVLTSHFSHSCSENLISRSARLADLEFVREAE
jgi:hypothetical protein